MNYIYTSDTIRKCLEFKKQKYLDKLYAERSPTWNCDQRTKDLFCLSQWLMEEIDYYFNINSIFAAPSNEDRSDTLDFFNRKSRAEEDLFELAALAMNNLLQNKIERFRRPAIK